MYKLKYLKRYSHKCKFPENDDFLYFINNLLGYHKKHLMLRKLLKQHEKVFMEDPEEFVKWMREYKFAEKQMEVNANIKAFFMIIIIELYKRIEEDNIFRGILDESISMDGYYYSRVKYKKKELVDTITKQIKHFRDACVHKEDDKISTIPEFVEHNIEGGEIHLPFVSYHYNEEWCFMIGKGIIPFHRLEGIIECTLNYYYQ